MSHDRARRLAWALWALVLALASAATVFGALGDRGAEDLSVFVTAVLVFQVFATVGAVLASRLPSNAIGWLFLAVPLSAQTANATGLYVELAVARDLPGEIPVTVASSWTWETGLLLLAYLVALFPDGRLPFRSRRAGERLMVAVAPVFVAQWIFRPGPLAEPLEGVENPVGIPGLDILGEIFSVTLALVMLAAAIGSQAYRYWKRPAQRQQLKWLLGAASLAGLALLADALADQLVPGYYGGPDEIFLLLLGTIPVAAGIAILRYRLYDIDLIIRRTLVYTLLTASLAALYFGLVLALQTAFSSFAGGSDLAIAGSTLAVAALFRPARQRLQTAVERRFYRRRYDAAHTLTTFATHARDQVDLDTLATELGHAVANTMQPRHISLWIRPHADEAGP